ncbi:MAG TPA: ATP-dependent Clp protease proteolytic subunit [bacterium]|nr:ATP-dependent Clp protease proteolytic subunit [bacterium]HOL34651.1 ATP-dependent Clp protease proteolytic subunit [bacterium]
MNRKNVVIKFFAPVMDASINALMNAIDQKMREGVSRFTILISSPGGSVFHGLSAYNYLKGIPAEIITHNFGSVDSIGVVLFCAGKARLSVPQARFLLHGVSVAFRQNENLEEKQLEERLKGLRMDIENIAKIISSNSNKSVSEIINAMLERTTLNPQQAIEWGLVHEIVPELYESGSEVISIHFQAHQT